MRDLKAIEAELAAAKAEQEAAEKEAAKAVIEAARFEVRIVWTSPVRFRAEMRHTPETLAAYAAHKERFGRTPGFSGEPLADWKGMNMMLIDRYLISDGGGHVVLAYEPKEPRDKAVWDRDPVRVTPEQDAALRSGVIPKELLSEWVGTRL